jgi:hypothetical protein
MDNYYIDNKSNYILYLTPFCLYTSLLNLYRKQYILYIIELCVFISSFIHWSNPTYGWKRTIDITVVSIGIISHLYYMYINICFITFYCNIITLSSLYISINYSSYNMHFIAWIFACLGNICLSNCLYYSN